MSIVEKIQKLARQKIEEFLNEKAIVIDKTKVQMPQNVKPQQFSFEVSQRAIEDLSRKITNEAVATLTEQIQFLVADKKVEYFGENLVLNDTGSPDFYPNNCRLFLRREDEYSIIIEEPPQNRTIFYEPMNSDETLTARIPLPYLVFVLNFSRNKGQYYFRSCCIGASGKSINSIEDYVFSPNLPHCDMNGVCLPMAITPSNTIRELAEKFFTLFWNSSFIYEFKFFELNGKKINSFEDWSYIADPLIILKMYMNKNDYEGYKVKNLINGYNPAENYKTGLNQAISSKFNKIAADINKIDFTELKNTIQRMIEKSDLQQK